MVCVLIFLNCGQTARSSLFGRRRSCSTLRVGADFRSAYEAAVEVEASVVLGDRAVKLTLARTWAALSTWDRLRFVWMLLYTVGSVGSHPS